MADPPSVLTGGPGMPLSPATRAEKSGGPRDRKSTRLNSSHTVISYAVFCLKKKKNSEIKHAGLLRGADEGNQRHALKHLRIRRLLRHRPSDSGVRGGAPRHGPVARVVPLTD